MRNSDRWQPTTVVRDAAGGGFSPNFRAIDPGSWFIWAATVDAYLELIRRYVRGRLLDCGCGQVPYYEVYEDLVEEVVCVDWQENEYVDRRVDLNGALPFGDGAFDTVLAADVLEHLASPELFVREAARTLRPGGALLVMVPFSYCLHEEPHDYFRYTEFALRSFCRENGLDILHLDAYGGYPDIVLDLVNKGPLRRPRLASAALPLVRRLTATGRYRRWRAETKRRFPQGYCLAARKSG